ncbi:MAG: beta-ketoacyl-[acyl-carrier-protein] synthase II [Planctomycetales bacterium 4572_13]|nr:MAG: beta-ketoacyl-[acyl-carrier-protein] synthase II [Planctomycetales bacterium 4572_13]RLE41315.1 MAG: beta-ketoacyl-[acyl-carrier-protein] synthase II [Candidatus Woesearchaeota archaeon]
MIERRVVITGLGCITSLGESHEELFESLCQSKSGISHIESFDTEGYTVKIGGEAKAFDAGKYLNAREAKRMDRFTQMATAAAVQAVNDSGLDFEEENSHRAGVIVGSGIGGIKEIEEQHQRLLNKGPRKVSPFCVPKLMGNAACGCISIEYGLQGPNFCVVTACASASHAIGEAFWNILTDRSDICITGGSEAALTPVGLASFCSLRALSNRNDDPQLASRPFDKDRNGFVLAEGAGILILEEYEHAKKRDAKIYAELLGYGATGDGYHITAPLEDGSGAARAMKLALQQAKLNPEKIDYINAHGTSTQLNDAGESQAIRSVFGSGAYKIPVSSSKSCLGHSLGASGAIELIASAKTIEKGIIHPTANLQEVGEDCDPKMDFVPGQPRQTDVKYALSNSLGFGGHNCTLIISKV